MEFRIRGAKLGETGELGSFGYVTAALQVLGFAVGGLAVYGHLRAVPYCERCGKYLTKQSSITRYTNYEAQELQEVYRGVIALLQKDDSAAAARLLSGFGTTVEDSKLNAELKLWRCVTCPQESFDLSVNQRDGKDWKLVSGLRLVGYLPRG